MRSSSIYRYFTCNCFTLSASLTGSITLASSYANSRDCCQSHMTTRVPDSPYSSTIILPKILTTILQRCSQYRFGLNNATSSPFRTRENITWPYSIHKYAQSTCLLSPTTISPRTLVASAAAKPSPPPTESPWPAS